MELWQPARGSRRAAAGQPHQRRLINDDQKQEVAAAERSVCYKRTVKCPQFMRQRHSEAHGEKTPVSSGTFFIPFKSICEPPGAADVDVCRS